MIRNSKKVADIPDAVLQPQEQNDILEQFTRGERMFWSKPGRSPPPSIRKAVEKWKGKQ